MIEETVVIPGDGIGAEAIPAAVDVSKTAGDFEFVEVDAGDHAGERTGEAPPRETYNLTAEADATSFDAVGKTTADIILPLRTMMDSFVNIRLAKAYLGVDAFRPETDFAFPRENTEGVYSGHEDHLSEDLPTLMCVVTTSASERLAEYACDYAGGEDGSL